jgi:hypothetical protein
MDHSIADTLPVHSDAIVATWGSARAQTLHGIYNHTLSLDSVESSRYNEKFRCVSAEHPE